MIGTPELLMTQADVAFVAMEDAEEALERAAKAEDARRWRGVTASLRRWQRRPDEVWEHPIDPALLQTALQFAEMQRAGGRTAPSSVAPTPEGGISFEWWCGRDVRTLEIVERGQLEITDILGDSASDPVTVPLEDGWQVDGLEGSLGVAPAPSFSSLSEDDHLRYSFGTARPPALSEWSESAELEVVAAA